MASSRHAYATELSSLASGAHGRQRRQERGIEKVDLQRARRYGMKELQQNGRYRFTYGGVVFIFDAYKNREVTSFPSSDAASEFSGTKCTYPILLQKREDYEDDLFKRCHEETRARLMKDMKSWTSHSVLVVDMSGSMRRDDVNGARCRSDGVWMALARDFVKKQLEERTATATDLVTIIVMKESATVPIQYEPLDWVLYNKLVDMREWGTLRPSGPGNYMPALMYASIYLSINPHSSCALSLMFFSDGRPSDKGPFAEQMGEIAKKFGRRLTVCCIGMADDNEEQFSTLHEMVAEAEAFGAISSFNKRTMHTDSLSNIITSMVSSLTNSKTEITDLNTGKSKIVRTDVFRERKGTPDDVVLTHEWDAYQNTDLQRFVRRVWTWSPEKDDFLYIRDPRCIFCFVTVSTKAELMGYECPHCRACHICPTCVAKKRHKEHYASKECRQWRRDIQTGRLIKKRIYSFCAAMKKPIFDEGAERVVHKFRFLDDDGQFIGPKFVAKQSRFVENEELYEDRMNYHREFLRTQALASRFAHMFNAEIDGLVNHFDPKYHSWIGKMPRIMFLEPIVIEVVKDGKEVNILIEPMLEGKYQKFNNNFGWVHGQTAPTGNNSMNDLTNSLNQLDLKLGGGGVGGGGGLGAIEEGDEEEDESDEEEGIAGLFDMTPSGPDSGVYDNTHDTHFPQAFSHFTYVKSKRKLMVVDLQGMFVKAKSTSKYVFTDPVIHKRRPPNRRRSKNEKWTFGRTDRGEKGMQAFFDTHECNDVCRLLGLSDSKQKTSH